tara:strand:+ start:843 stop:1925 length:1083 start_codon:yes stop_codon:yes gene_type:complete
MSFTLPVSDSQCECAVTWLQNIRKYPLICAAGVQGSLQVAVDAPQVGLVDNPIFARHHMSQFWEENAVLELSISTLAFDGHDFSSACEGIAAAGALCVEPAFVASYGPVDEASFSPAKAASLRNASASAGLRCRTLSAHVDTGLPDAVEKLKRRLEFAAELGAVRLISNAAVASRVDVFRQNLPAIEKAAGAAGVRVCLENPGDTRSVLASPEEIMTWGREFQGTFLGINLDFGNLYTASNGEIEPARCCEGAIAAAENFHLKEFSILPGGLQACAIGDGVLDYATILKAIIATKPNATAGIELPLRVFRPTGGTPQFGPVLQREAIVEIMARSVAFIESACREASPDPARELNSPSVSY